MKALKAILYILFTTLILTGCKKDSDKQEIITAKASDFGKYHPCGIAVSTVGNKAVAVSTYEGDTQDGRIFIWESLEAFQADEVAKYAYPVKDPEAVAFDGSTLFVTCTYDSKIFYTGDMSKAPTNFFYVDYNGNNNPRGMAVRNGQLLVMCENLYPNPKNSKVLRVTNATFDSRTFKEVAGSAQPAANGNGLGLAIVNNMMYTTDLNSNSVSKYLLNADNDQATYSTRLGNAGATMDVTSDGGNYVYFTSASDACYLVRWNTANNETKNIKLGALDGIYAAWGVLYLNGKLYISDAPRHQVRIIDAASANWQN